MRKHKILFIILMILLCILIFVIFSSAAYYNIIDGKLFLLSGSDVPYLFYDPDLRNNVSSVVYVISGGQDANEIIMPDTNITNASELMNSNEEINIVAYYDPEIGKTIPYIRRGNRFIGKNFALQKNETYLIWNENEMNLTFDLR